MNKKIVLVFAVLIILIGAVILLKSQFVKSDKPVTQEQPQPKFLPFGGDKIDISKMEKNEDTLIKECKGPEEGEIQIRAILSPDGNIVVKFADNYTENPINLEFFIYDKTGREILKKNLGEVTKNDEMEFINNGKYLKIFYYGKDEYMHLINIKKLNEDIIEKGVSANNAYLSPDRNLIIYRKRIRIRNEETNSIIEEKYKTIVRNFEKGYVKELDYGDLALISIAEDNFFTCVFGITIMSFDNMCNLLWKHDIDPVRMLGGHTFELSPDHKILTYQYRNPRETITVDNQTSKIITEK